MGNEKSVIVASLVILLIGGVFYAAEPSQGITGRSFFSDLFTRDKAIASDLQTYEIPQQISPIVEQPTKMTFEDYDTETLTPADVSILRENRDMLNRLFDEGLIFDGALFDENIKDLIYGSSNGVGDKPPALNYKRCGKKKTNPETNVKFCTQTDLCSLGENLECNIEDCLCKCPADTNPYKKNGKPATSKGDDVALCCPADQTETTTTKGACGAAQATCQATGSNNDNKANSANAGLKDGQAHCYQTTTCEAQQNADGSCTVLTTVKYSAAKL